MNVSKLTIFKSLMFCALLTATLGSVTGIAHASLSFNPENTFSGTAPAGYLTANFTDIAGGVQLVITSNLAAGENIDPNKALYFNMNPSQNAILQNLTFRLTGNANFNQQATVNTGDNKFKADGDGYYDILFSYNHSTNAFTTGQSQTYFITASSGSIRASDFTNYLSYPGGGTGTWLAAAHVQNTPLGGSGSAWVGGTVTPTPIPAAALLFGSGLMGLAGIRRKMKQA